MGATLVIERRKSFIGCVLKAKIQIDGREIGTVANGQTASFPIAAGPQRVAAFLGMASGRPLDINPAEGETVKLKCGMKMGWFVVSDFELTREDGSGPEESSAPAAHHGKVVLIFGCLGLLIGLIGLAAMCQGIIDLKKMKNGRMESSGRGMTLAGTIIGGFGFVFNLAGRIMETFLPS